MTENEALKLMKSLQISKDCELVKTIDFKATVIKALENLQQYRAIGTVEELKLLQLQNHLGRDEALVVGRKEGYNKAIDEFYDKVLNFEDYIEPIGVTDITEYSTTLLYSGVDITNMIVKIKKQLKAGDNNE